MGRKQKKRKQLTKNKPSLETQLAAMRNSELEGELLKNGYVKFVNISKHGKVIGSYYANGTFQFIRQKGFYVEDLETAFAFCAIEAANHPDLQFLDIINQDS